jgi:hypothetical protein
LNQTTILSSLNISNLSSLNNININNISLISNLNVLNDTLFNNDITINSLFIDNINTKNINTNTINTNTINTNNNLEINNLYIYQSLNKVLPNINMNNITTNTIFNILNKTILNNITINTKLTLPGITIFNTTQITLPNLQIGPLNLAVGSLYRDSIVDASGSANVCVVGLRPTEIYLSYNSKTLINSNTWNSNNLTRFAPGLSYFTRYDINSSPLFPKWTSDYCMSMTNISTIMSTNINGTNFGYTKDKSIALITLANISPPINNISYTFFYGPKDFSNPNGRFMIYISPTNINLLSTDINDEWSIYAKICMFPKHVNRFIWFVINDFFENNNSKYSTNNTIISNNIGVTIAPLNNLGVQIYIAFNKFGIVTRCTSTSISLINLYLKDTNININDIITLRNNNIPENQNKYVLRITLFDNNNDIFADNNMIYFIKFSNYKNKFTISLLYGFTDITRNIQIGAPVMYDLYSNINTNNGESLPNDTDKLSASSRPFVLTTTTPITFTTTTTGNGEGNLISITADNTAIGYISGIYMRIKDPDTLPYTDFYTNYDNYINDNST